MGKYLEYLFQQIPSWVKIKGIIILKFSPFGKAESVFKRILKTYDVFGFKFFIRYLIKYLYGKFINKKYLIQSVIKRNNVPELNLTDENLNSKESLAALKKLSPDLIISISANQIFKKELLSLPRFGCLNLHTALLPNYKGLMPTFWALKNNESELGVTVFIMDEGIDTGDILIQKIISIRSQDTLETLIQRSKKEGIDALISAIEMIKSGNYKTFRYKETDGTYHTFPTRKDVKEFIYAGKKFW